MDRFFHSVTLDKEKCVGCTNCIKRCPTQAIRVRGQGADHLREVHPITPKRRGTTPSRC